MNGVENRSAGKLEFHQTNFKDLAYKLAENAGLAVQECPSYLFLYPATYEPLRDISLVGRLDPAFADVRAAMAFGSNTPLYNAFKALSQVVGITIVGDNAIAEANCGEISLGEIPIQDALEAVLKSARVYSFEVESTNEYIFFRAPANTQPATALLSAETLDDRQKALLEKQVSVVLPTPPDDAARIELASGAKPLGKVVGSLSRQLGAPVAVERGLEELPVNPAAFHRVRVSTALDLLIRQWLVPEFGYQLTSDRIVIRRK